MRTELAQPLRLNNRVGQAVPMYHFAVPRRRAATNAQLGVGLWLLLWLGYNTGPGYVMNSDFPASAMQFVHGIRAFFPMVAAWFACLTIFARSKRVFAWVMGPLGLILLYAVTGLVSSATLSPDPTFAMYYGANYLAIILVLLAVVAVDDPLPDLRQMLNVTWIVGAIFTLGLLGAIPFLGSQALTEGEAGPIGVRAYTSAHGTIMGMAMTRNTGFARYAAISALVTLPAVMRRGKPVVRLICGAVLLASLYALVIANGRTEILAFVGSAVVILIAERAKRTVNILAAIGAAILLGLRGFYSGFFLYLTRTGHVDATMSGRTLTWEQAWQILWRSPWVGFGFQADRYFLGQHMHNAYLHVFFQSGFLGGGAILVGLAIVWYDLIKYFFVRPPADRTLIPPEIPAVFLFVTISSFTESTFAYFSAAWLLSAPIVAYVMALHRGLRRSRARAVQEQNLRMQSARRGFRTPDRPDRVPVTARSVEQL